VRPVLVTISQAAALLAVSRSKVYQLITAGDISVIRLGKSVRIRMSDLEAIGTTSAYP
jgi:excisionase family DNA binding protein